VGVGFCVWVVVVGGLVGVVGVLSDMCWFWCLFVCCFFG